MCCECGVLVRAEAGVRRARSFLLLAAGLHHDTFSTGGTLPGIVAQEGEHLLLKEADAWHPPEDMFFRTLRTLH